MAEREQRAAVFERLLTRQENLMKEMGEADQQLELLTLMKHGVDKFESVLTPRELDVIAATFNELVQRSGVVAVVMPNWFVASPPDNAQKLYVQDGEEACLRQATILASLNHPNIRKFYGACHVGSAFIVHEKTQPGPPTWHFFLGCALGLAYLHRRGFICGNLNDDALCFATEEKRGERSGLDLKKIDNRAFALQKRMHPRILADMAAFGRMIFLILAQYREDTCFDALEKPPIVQPDFLSDNEWNLLHVLWNADPTEEGCMSNAVERMKYLVKMEKIQNQQDRKINESWSESLSSFSVGGSVVDDMETYVISTADMTLTEALNEVGETLLRGRCTSRD
ncbi:hypothetical protein PI126_g21627 [Phytophthora idaei]|nr:hypothetical protein PI126_g21627 [Phytophthora idaei]